MTSAVPSDPAGAEHVPVLPAEVMAGLAIGPGARIIDATLGGGGHTAQFLADSAPTGTVLGIDADPAALRRVEQRLPDAGGVQVDRKGLAAVRGQGTSRLGGIGQLVGAVATPQDGGSRSMRHRRGWDEPF